MEMLYKYREAFSLRDEIGTCPNIEVEIEVTNKSPFFIRLYHVRKEDKAFIDKKMKRLCYMGIYSAYSSPVMLISRKLTKDKRVVTVSPIVANLHMEYLKQKALSTAPNLPRFWCRFVDDTFVIHKEVSKQGFLQHINSVDPAIKFTVEDNKEDGSIPSLDTIVKPETDGTQSITVYRKPTHTDQYLQWDSYHHLLAKFSVIHILFHRAITVCSKPELHQQEKDHLRKALT